MILYKVCPKKNDSHTCMVRDIWQILIWVNRIDVDYKIVLKLGKNFEDFKIYFLFY